MLYMVIERFKNRNAKAAYRRLSERGRMLPDGVSFISSWVETNQDRCFQMMDCGDESQLHRWADNWSDLVDFEFVPVISGAEMAETMA